MIKITTIHDNDGTFTYDGIKSIEIISDNLSIFIKDSTKNFNKNYILGKLSKYRDTDPELWIQLSSLVEDYGYLGALEYLNPNKKRFSKDIYLLEKSIKILEEMT